MKKKRRIGSFWGAYPSRVWFSASRRKIGPARRQPGHARVLPSKSASCGGDSDIRAHARKLQITGGTGGSPVWRLEIVSAGRAAHGRKISAIARREMGKTHVWCRCTTETKWSIAHAPGKIPAIATFGEAPQTSYVGLPLESILKSKQAVGRPKDLAHIPLIRQVLRLRKRTSKAHSNQE